MRFPTMWHVRQAKAQIKLRIRAALIRPFTSRLDFLKVLSLSLKEAAQESTVVKMPHCWKLHVAAHIGMA